MLDVFITLDVEIWCDGWDDIDAKFPAAFRRYVYGETPQGNFGLPYQLDLLQAHGLAAVCFVEPLFATRFGLSPLAEVVGLIREGGHETQLHLHTEWVDEAVQPLLTNSTGKRQFLRYFTPDEQHTLIAAGTKLLAQAGGTHAVAFRAGGFGFNRDTLGALAANGIKFDSSYNASCFGPDSGVMPGTLVVEPTLCDQVFEYPLTVFRDGRGRLRHTQITACSFRELEGLLWQALETRRRSFVILSHNFELLNRAMNRPDRTVLGRFRKLCGFLEKNSDSFRVRGFADLQAEPVAQQPPPLRAPAWQTMLRMLGQAARRRYG